MGNEKKKSKEEPKVVKPKLGFPSKAPENKGKNSGAWAGGKVQGMLNGIGPSPSRAYLKALVGDQKRYEGIFIKLELADQKKRNKGRADRDDLIKKGAITPAED